MRGSIIAFILASLALTSLSQSRLSVGAWTAPSMSYELHNGLSPFPSTLGDHELHSIPWPALSSGLDVRFKLSDRWSLRSGSEYALNNLRLKNIMDTRYLIDEDGQIDYARLRWYDATQSNHYFRIPLSAMYVFPTAVGKDAHFFVSAGGHLSILFRRVWRGELHDGMTREAYGIQDIQNPLNSGVRISGGVITSLNDQLDLVIEPMYSYELFAEMYQRFNVLAVRVGVSGEFLGSVE